MTPDKPNPARAAARTGSGKHHKRLASDLPGFNLSAPPRQAQSRLRRQRLVERLHRLGPKPLSHFLDEVERGASIPDHLERYAALPADFILANGGDEFTPFLWPIEGGRR